MSRCSCLALLAAAPVRSTASPCARRRPTRHRGGGSPGPFPRGGQPRRRAASRAHSRSAPLRRASRVHGSSRCRPPPPGARRSDPDSVGPAGEAGRRRRAPRSSVPTDVSFVVHQEGAFLSFSFRDPDRGPWAGTSLLVAAHAPAADPEPRPAPAPALAPRPWARATPAPASRDAGLRRSRCRRRSHGGGRERGATRAREDSGGGGLADARVRREGGEVIVTFDVGAEAVPASPAAAPPVDNVHVEKVASLAVIHVTVAPEVPFDVKREPRLIDPHLRRGGPRAAGPAAPPPPPAEHGVDVATLVDAGALQGPLPRHHHGPAGDRERRRRVRSRPRGVAGGARAPPAQRCS